MTLTKKDIEEAAQLTPEEIDLINNAAESLMRHEPRPVVLMALASQLIGIVVQGSKGILSKEIVVDLVAKAVEV